MTDRLLQRATDHERLSRGLKALRDSRERFVSELIGRPYLAGGNGPHSFDCYGLTRHVQREVFGRTMPPFFLPREAGRFAIASAIAAHPERELWLVVTKPADGDIAIMSRQDCGFHMGTYLDLDGGIVLHALEKPGVCADDPFRLASVGGGRWRIAWNRRAATAAAVAA